MSLIKLLDVSKYYKSEETVSLGMKRINLEFDLGEFVAVTGESGSGKSTLLNVLSGLDGYEEGELYLFDEETSHYTMSDWEKYRGTYIGFVFQNYNIIDSYTVLQNVLLALEVQGYDPKLRKQRALELIEQVGLTSHKNHKASKLSGGQKQRTVIARALAKDCPIIVADEPTGNLDSESGKQVIELLHNIAKDKLIIVVTHDYDQVSDYATRKIKMHDGEVVEDKKLKQIEQKDINQKLETKKLPFLTLLKFAARNLLATPKKLIFVMLMQILVIGAFTIVYSDRISAVREAGLAQSDTYPSVPKTRVLVEKRDGTAFTTTEINEIKNHRSSNQVYENAFLFYNTERLNLYRATDYYYDNVSATDTHHSINSSDITGDRPVEANEIIYGSSGFDVNIGDELIINISGFDDELNRFTVVGIDELERSIIYFSDAYLEQTIDSGEMIDYSKYYEIYNMVSSSMEIEALGDVYAVYSYGQNFLSTDLLIDGEGSRTISFNQSITISYYTLDGASTIQMDNLTISVPEDTYGYIIIDKPLMDEIMASIMLEYEDEYMLDEMYLISVSVDGYYAGNRLIKDLDMDTYKVYYPSNLSSPLREFMVFFQGLLAVIYLTLFGLFLYSIVHAVTKNVMNARKKDFAIFRSIGTSKTTLARLVVLEQVLISIVGFILVMIIMTIVGEYVFFLKATIQYMETQDYFYLLIIFILFGAWLGLRFNKRVFKQSVIETLSQSKGE